MRVQRMMSTLPWRSQSMWASDRLQRRSLLTETLPVQRKEKGRKTVLTMSSAAAIMSGASAGSRDLEAPFNYADGVMVAYKASKTALNQGVPQ